MVIIKVRFLYRRVFKTITIRWNAGKKCYYYDLDGVREFSESRAVLARELRNMGYKVKNSRDADKAHQQGYGVK